MSNISHHPHDKLVDKFLEDKEVAISLLKNHLLPTQLERLDLSTLQATSETAVSDQWKKYHNDIVFQCKTKDNKNAYIYTLIEHQSTPDPFMPIRILRYKLNVLSKYLDSKNPPKKLPNIMSLVIYHGEQKYPYEKDIFSCFEDKELAMHDITKPMLLLDLSETPKKELIEKGGADAVFKLLLKYSRTKDFIGKIQELMFTSPDLFLSLSLQQAGYMYEYAMFVGKGTPENAKNMENAMQQVYGETKARKIFSLADYYKQEARKEGKKEGMEKGMEKGKKERNIEIAKQMIVKGMKVSLISELTGLSLEQIKKLQ